MILCGLKIKDIIIKSIISVADDSIQKCGELTKHKNTLFELYGFDVLIDSDLTPWLLEINLNPSLNCDTQLDLKVKSSLMTDIFNLIGLVPYSHLKPKTRWEEPKLLADLITEQNNNNNDIESDNNNISETNTAISNDVIIIKDDDSANDNLYYSLDEFSRTGMFNRLFPREENVDYYSKFISKPGEDNVKLWKFLKNTEYTLKYKKICDEKENV